MAGSVQDSAFAWVLCVACFLNITLVGGIVQTPGIFYIMFRDSLHASDYEVSIITSLNIGVLHFVSPFAGLLCGRYGVRCVSVIGAVLSTVGLACAAFSMQIYQMYITYGLIAGIGLGVVANCSVIIIDPYFNKYKRMACGLVFTGHGVGSFILPPIINSLEDVYGWRGAILILAGISMQMVLTCALFRPFHTHHVNNDIPKHNVSTNDDEGTCGSLNEHGGCAAKHRGLKYKIIRAFSLFKIIPFSCICVFTLFYILSLSTLLTHFGSYVLTLGFSNEDVVRLYMAIGISSTISRPIIGVIAQVTKANVAALIMSALLLAGIVSLTVPLMTKLWMFYLYGVISLILVTPPNILPSVTIMEHVPASQVAVAYGLTQVLSVPGHLLGGPLAVWLYDYTDVYTHTFFLVGGLLILSGLVMIPASYHIYKEGRETLLPASANSEIELSVVGQPKLLYWSQASNPGFLPDDTGMLPLHQPITLGQATQANT